MDPSGIQSDHLIPSHAIYTQNNVCVGQGEDWNGVSDEKEIGIPYRVTEKTSKSEGLLDRPRHSRCLGGKSNESASAQQAD